MSWNKNRRLMEMAGIIHRSDPDLLVEGEEGDDVGTGGDPFETGDDDAGFDAAAEDAPADDTEVERIPPEELSPQDIENFGSPRFKEVESKLTSMFNDAMTSAAAASQNIEVYPGKAIPEDEEPEPTPAKDEEANESFYRYGNRRDKWLINEAQRLLFEAEEEGATADTFDMEDFANNIANYMDTVTKTQDVEAGVYNAARQMIMNNFGEDTAQEFTDMLAAVTKGKYEFLPVSIPDVQQEIPVAAGATGGGGAA